MQTLKTLLLRILPAVLMTIAVAGCSAKAKQARLLENADKYFQSGEYDKAKIEYLNLLRKDRENVQAIQQLGIIWYEEGAPLQAFPFLLKARDLAPTNLSARSKLASAFLAVGHRAEARKEVLAILQQDATHDEAILLLAQTIQTKEDFDYTQQQLEKLNKLNKASVHLATAALAFQNKDPESAERSLRQALEADPKSASAHLAMANFYWSKNDLVHAEEEFKSAAGLGRARSGERFRYAQFKAKTGASEEAKTLLKEVTSQAADYLPAWNFQAQIAFEEKKYEESLAFLENIFGRDSMNLEARLLQAKACMAQGEVKKGVECLERLGKMYPKVPLVLYQLGSAYMQDANPAQAVVSLTQAVTANPDYLEAVLLLAEVKLRSGEPQEVVTPMLELLKKRPHLAQAELLLADAYRGLGRLDECADIFREQVKASPKNSQAYFSLGLVLLQQKKTDEARKAIETAHELAPDNLVPAFQLVDLDIQSKDYKSAQQRVDKQAQKTPGSAWVHFLQGKIYVAQREWEAAEVSLRKALDLDPNLAGVYELLTSTYVAANKLPQAIAQLEAFLAKSPNNARGLMTLALIYDKTSEYAKAADAYEKVLAVNPDSVPALNNLAYLYGHRLNQLDKAYDLARRARTLQPADGAIADTLGWILYQRADYQQALTLLQESAGKFPDSPEVQFHLGMANYMMGRTEAAQTAFRIAAKSPADFPGKEELQRRLALLGDSPGNSTELSTDQLEAMLQQQPSDLVVRMRLGDSYEKQKAFAKAAAAYEQVIKVNPKLLSATIKLAQLYAGPLQNKDKALGFAKAAREFAPADPEVAAVLGSIVFQTGNSTWAYSLLQESAQQLPKDAKVLHDFAWAAYSLGRVSEAQEAMKNVLKVAPDSSQSGDAKTFLAMTALESKELAAAEPAAEQILKEDPAYLPALMVRAAIDAQRGKSKVASSTYAEILRRFPDFAVAQKYLASLYLEEPEERSKAYDLALKARKTLPEDPELTQILGEISYQRKEYAYAIQLLRESAEKRPLSAKLHYYLGMSHWQIKQKPESQDAIEHALAAGLQEPLLADAKRVLAELQKK